MKTRWVLFSALLLTLAVLTGVVHADCRGCCSYHGGVVCRNGKTMCADGTPLSQTCVNKGCNVCSVVNPPPDPPSDPVLDLPTGDLNIAGFNIQTFGVTKASKPDVMQVLAEIITEFDIVAVQEIRDSELTAVQALEDKVDALGVDYEYIVSLPLGRTTYKEQYAFFYRVDKIDVMAQYTYEDLDDWFMREPFVGFFSAKNGRFDFILITIHTEPDNATSEIYSLEEVVEDARSRYPLEKDIIVIGDLNADCSYFDESDPLCPLRDSQYTWLISNEMDTNVASSECTYDRLIMTNGAVEDYMAESGVYRFDAIFDLTDEEAVAVSDHYPIWGSFYLNKDNDPPGDVQRPQVEAFVTRFYQLCLSRDPDADGLNYWVTSLLDSTRTGADVAKGFIFSQEFLNKNILNEDYLNILYEAFFNRQPDAAGYNYWLDQLKASVDRSNILDGFIYSQEFANLCDDYEITPFPAADPVTEFVTRFYQLCLGRNPDQDGLDYWVNSLKDGSRTGGDVAFGFVFSQEFLNMGTSNEQYLDVLYHAFFNRDPDQGGFDGWLSQLNGGASREDVLRGFIYAQEFYNLCNEYGINRS